jgi:hypothetical protein
MVAARRRSTPPSGPAAASRTGSAQLGAFAVTVAIASIGYALGRPVRERQLGLPLTGPSVAGEAAG